MLEVQKKKEPTLTAGAKTSSSEKRKEAKTADSVGHCGGHQKNARKKIPGSGPSKPRKKTSGKGEAILERLCFGGGSGPLESKHGISDLRHARGLEKKRPGIRGTWTVIC